MTLLSIRCSFASAKLCISIFALDMQEYIRIGQPGWKTQKERMMDYKKEDLVGQSLFGFQAALKQDGSSLMEYINNHYMDRWLGETLAACLEV
ncbi:MAG: hypothetical protein WC889_06685, partial [Myxococcota bacterium]